MFILQFYPDYVFSFSWGVYACCQPTSNNHKTKARKKNKDEEKFVRKKKPLLIGSGKMFLFLFYIIYASFLVKHISSSSLGSDFILYILTKNIFCCWLVVCKQMLLLVIDTVC